MQEFGLSSQTEEWLYAPVSLANTDPNILVSAAPVAFAVVAAGQEPGMGDWHPGEWVGAPSSSAGTARVLVGGTGVPLGHGVKDAFVRLTLADETPVRKFCRLYVD